MAAPSTDTVERIITTHLNKKTFSACALGLSRRVGKSFEGFDMFRGTTGIHITDPPVDRYSFFDIASLTKPLFTLLSLLSLIREGKISFSAELDSLLPCRVPEDKKKITLLQLIGHRSGLPAHKNYHARKEKNGRLDSRSLCRWIIDEPLQSCPGEVYRYSDLDYILLGRIVEHLSGENMATYWRREIIGPLALDDEFYIYGEPAVRGKKCVATISGTSDEEHVWGQVHDDNCRAAGRVLGHAGLFSTLHGVVSLCNCILLSCRGYSGHPAWRDSDMRQLLQSGAGSQWACGFDVRTGSNPSSGRYFSKMTIGHLGFTGTSMWIDLEKMMSVVLLTNRVIYGLHTQGILCVRPQLHDAVMRSYSSDII